MKKYFLLTIMIVAQLAVPAAMIARQERVLEKGSVYKFKTAPVDPYDIFRGRYVALATEQRSAPFRGKDRLSRGQDVYIVLKIDHNGYALVQEAVLKKPVSGDYLAVKVNYLQGKTVYFQQPFPRYYMNEKKAPEAERIYRNRNRRQAQEAYIQVRVHNGRGVIEGLYLDNKPIENYLNDVAKAK